MVLRLLIALLFALPAAAESVVPLRTIRAHAIITETDVMLRQSAGTDGFARLEDVVGQEARVVLYAGRPIRAGDVGPPALISRNQLVRMAFNAHGLHILTEARALERGAEGDMIRVMNLSSRATVIARVESDGSVSVNP